MKNIIIAGANGRLGAAIKNYLLNFCSYNIYEIDRNFYIKSCKNNSISAFKDLSKNSFLINCAGEKNNINLMKKANYEFPIKLFDLCVKNNIKKFIHISSVGSFGAKRYSGEISEDFQYIDTNNCYESSKAMFDKFLLSKTQLNQHCILMPSNIIFNDDKPFKNYIKILNFARPKISNKDGWLNFIHEDAIHNIIGKIIDGKIHHEKIIINEPIRYSKASILIAQENNIRYKNFIIPKLVAKIIYEFFSFLGYIGFNLGEFITRRIYEMDNNISFVSRHDDIKKISKKYGVIYILEKSNQLKRQ